MNYLNPFEQSGFWYKGNTHLHSSTSDGLLSISDCFEGYKQHKYDFIVLTDHDNVSDVSRYSDDTFLAISGSELEIDNPYGGTPYDVVCINIHINIEVKNKHPNEVIAEIKEQGGISVLAHPYWSGHTLLDLQPLHGYFGVEVFNTNCGMTGRAVSETQWDALLERVGPVLGIACDDAHSLYDMYQGWIMVKSSDLSVNSIMDSLIRGLFYSTQGPEIFDFRIDESVNSTLIKMDSYISKRIIAKFSPSKSVVFKTDSCKGKNILAHEDKLITEAVYDLSGDEKYVRLEITAQDGKKAWSQPIIFLTG